MNIDYGNGQTNIDVKTGIRYGCMSQHMVTQAWCETAEADYGKPEEAICPECDTEIGCDTYNWGDSITCPECENEFEVELPDCCEPIAWYVDDGEYKAVDCLDSDILIIKSPYYTYANYCSPCVPGAGCITDDMPAADKSDCKCYCFGHDWFDDEIAPYPVYRVSDNKRLNAFHDKIKCAYCNGTGRRTVQQIADIRKADYEQTRQSLIKSGTVLDNDSFPCSCDVGMQDTITVVEMNTKL